MCMTCPYSTKSALREVAKMIIKLKKQPALQITGALALIFMLALIINAISKGNWSPVQIAAIVVLALVAAASAFYFFRVTGDYEVKVANLVLALCSIVITLIRSSRKSFFSEVMNLEGVWLLDCSNIH